MVKGESIGHQQREQHMHESSIVMQVCLLYISCLSTWSNQSAGQETV